MDANSRKDVVILAGVGLVAAGFCGYLVMKSAPAAKAALDAVPADSFIVGELDLTALAGTPLGGALAGDGGAASAEGLLGLSSVQTKCGFDPVTHMRSIVVTVPSANVDFGVAGSGDLDANALEACGKTMFEAGHRTLTEKTEGTYKLLVDAEPRGASLAFRPGGPSLVGRGAWLDKMVAVADGREPGLSASPVHTQLRAELAKEDQGPSALVITAVLPPDMRSALRAEAAAETADGGAPTGPLGGVLGVSSVGLSLHPGGTRAGDDTRVTALVHCDDEAACKNVETLVLHERLQLSGQIGPRLLGLGPLIDGLEATHPTPTTLLLRSHIDAATLARSLERFLAKPPDQIAHPR